MIETVIFDYITPHRDLDLENGKPIFFHDILAHDSALPHQLWLKKVQKLSGYAPDDHSLKF